MNKIQKSISAIVAIVLLVTVTLVTFAFKGREMPKTNKVIDTQAWYSLTPTSSSSHSSQIIIGGPSSLDPEETDDCNLINDGNYCAVKFNYVSPLTPPASYPTGTTVADVLATGATIVLEGNDEVYARKPQN